MWKITALYYGYLTGCKGDFDGGLDPDMMIELPYIGFLLRNGKENVLVDTGIADEFLELLPLSDVPPVGGRRFVLDALKQEDLSPEDIDTVIYTHLNNDHAGCAELFPHAKTYIQKTEWDNLLHPLPEQQERLDYDLTVIDKLKTLDHIVWLDGDMILENGLEIYHTPGHTRGMQVIVVPTEKGRYVLTGDLSHLPQALFPYMETMYLLDGTQIPITSDKTGGYRLTSFIYDSEAARKSIEKVKKLGERFEPEFYLTSHDPSVVIRKYFG